MTKLLSLNEIFKEAEAILDRGYHNGSVTHPDGSSVRFHASRAELSYSIDGGKTMIYLGEVNVGDVHIDPPALD